MRTAPCLLAAALLVCSAAPSPAGADEIPVDPGEIGDTARIERVAEELADDPLFIDAEQYETVGADDRAKIRDRIDGFAADGLTVRVAVVSARPFDESGGSPTVFLHALYRHTEEPGVYIATSRSGPTAAIPFDVPVATGFMDGRWNEPRHHQVPVPFRINKALDDLEEAEQAEPTVPAPTADPEPRFDGRSAGPRGSGEEFGLAALGIGVPFALVAALTVGVFTGAGGMYRNFTRGRGGRAAVLPAHPRLRRRWGGPGPYPVRARRAPAAPSLSWLERTLRAELSALEAEKDTAGKGPSHDAAEVAGRLLRAPHAPHSALVAAIAMVREQRAAATTTTAPAWEPPCSANPLHGRADMVDPEAVGSGKCHGCRTAPPAIGRQLLRLPGVEGRPEYFFYLNDPWTQLLRRGDVSPESLRRLADGTGLR